jgi:tetratricopeptide (TPR) repeat protein
MSAGRERADRERLGELFERTLALEPSERAAFLEAHCGDDVELRAELTALLASHAAAPGYLERLGGRLFPAALEALSENVLPVGRVVGRYEILERIGAGGMGVVYKARDLALDRPVALKFLPMHLSADPLARDRLKREARAVSALDHPNIAVIHEIGATDPAPDDPEAGRLFIAMAYYPGETLEQKIGRVRLAIPQAVDYAIQLADALATAHRASILHRDVKPANVLITDTGQLKLVDFGVAKVTGAEGAREGATPGTIAYMSPEQTRGEAVDQRTDIWSLGALLYEMLSGARPFRGDADESVVDAIRHDEPQPLDSLRRDVPREVARIVARCLAKDTARRYPSADALLAELRTVAERAGRRRHGRLLWAGAVAVGAMAVGLAAGLHSRPGTALSDYPVRTPVLVADFVGSADAGYRDVARDIVSTVLDQSATVAAVSREQTRRGLALAGRPDTVRVDESLARELAMRGGIGPIVLGHLDRVGRTFVIILRAEIGADGTPIATQRAVAQSEDDLVAAVDGAARRLREELALRRERLPGGGPYFQVITPSLAAYLKFAEGVDHHIRQHDWIAALGSYSEALELDPDFAAAWVQVGATYFNRGMLDSARAAYVEALRRPERLTPTGRLDAEGLVALVNGDQLGAYRRYDELRRRHGVSHNNLGVILRELGRPEEALEVYERAALPFGPTQLTLRNEVNLLLEDLGRHEEALERAERLEDPYQRVEIRWLHALLTADWNRADSIAAEVADDVLSPAWVREEAMAVRASVAVARGAVAAAGRYLSAASTIAAKEGRAERLRRNELSLLALALAAPGASSGSRLAVQHDVEAPLAMAHRAFEEAVLGDTAVTVEILGRLREFASEQRPQGAWPKLLEASLLARAGRWAEVPGALHRANPGPARDGAESILVWWLKADAYARLGEPDSAAAYLDKLGDSQAVARVTGSVSRTTGSVFIGMVYPFAHQRLTVLHARAGRIEEARRHWSIFSRTFTDPDPELVHLVDEAWQALLDGSQHQADRAPTVPPRG